MPTISMEVFTSADGKGFALALAIDDGQLVRAKPDSSESVVVFEQIRVIGSVRSAYNRVRFEYLQQGFRSAGTYPVTDVGVKWDAPLTEEDLSAVELFPQAYAMLKGKNVADDICTLLHSSTLFQVVRTDNSLCVALPEQGLNMNIVHTGAGMQVQSMSQDGALGRIVVLGLAHRFGVSAYDIGGKDHGKEWIQEAPELFFPQELPEQVIEQALIDVGLRLPRIKLKKGAKTLAL